MSNIPKEFARNNKDTGSSEMQIAISTYSIVKLALHLNKFKKDHSARKGLIAHVNKRKKLMQYLSKKHPNIAKKTMKKLNIKKY